MASFNTVEWLLSTTFAEQAGASKPRARQLGMITSMLKMPL